MILVQTCVFAACAATLGIEGTSFTLDGRPHEPEILASLAGQHTIVIDVR